MPTEWFAVVLLPLYFAEMPLLFSRGKKNRLKNNFYQRPAGLCAIILLSVQRWYVFLFLCYPSSFLIVSLVFPYHNFIPRAFSKLHWTWELLFQFFCTICNDKVSPMTLGQRNLAQHRTDSCFKKNLTHNVKWANNGFLQINIGNTTW